jgi:hypothetical protein
MEYNKMRLHLKDLDPVVHGWIAQHKAECKFNNKEDTVASLVQLAMLDHPEKIEGLESLIDDLHDEIRELEIKLHEA